MTIDRAGMRKPPISSSSLSVADQAIDRRVEPQRLLDHPAGERQPREVVGGGRAAAEHVGDLVAEATLGLGVLGEQVAGPGEGDGRRLVAGPDERDDLVAQLPVGEALAGLLVAGGQEHREQVARIVLGGSAAAPAMMSKMRASRERIARRDRRFLGVGTPGGRGRRLLIR